MNAHDDHYRRIEARGPENIAIMEARVLVGIPEEYHATARRNLCLAMAMKHITRAGEKDDPSKEIEKAENYLHRAKTGRWNWQDAPVCSPVLTADESTQNEAAGVKESLTTPEIPAGWIVWDREITWEKVAKVAKRWAHGTWIRAEEGYNSGECIIIPGQDAGEALVGVECWVWDAQLDAKNVECRHIVTDAVKGGPYSIGTHLIHRYRHARPTYLGRHE